MVGGALVVLRDQVPGWQRERRAGCVSGSSKPRAGTTAAVCYLPLLRWGDRSPTGVQAKPTCSHDLGPPCRHAEATARLTCTGTLHAGRLPPPYTSPHVSLKGRSTAQLALHAGTPNPARPPTKPLACRPGAGPHHPRTCSCRTAAGSTCASGASRPRCGCPRPALGCMQEHACMHAEPRYACAHRISPRMRLSSACGAHA